MNASTRTYAALVLAIRGEQTADSKAALVGTGWDTATGASMRAEFAEVARRNPDLARAACQLADQMRA